MNFPKWIELAGQTLVLASAGFQLFVLGHWQSQNEIARHADLRLSLARLESAEARIGDKIANPDIHDAMMQNSLQIELSSRKVSFYSLVGGVIFLIGGAMIIFAQAKQK